MFTGRHQFLVRLLSVNSNHFTRCDISILSREISMKLGVNIHRTSACSLLKMFSRSEVKGQGHSETKCTFLRRRNTFRRCDVEGELFLLFISAHRAIYTDLT